MKIIILSCSLSEDSKSRSLAHELLGHWEAGDGPAEFELLDLRDYDLPLCDGDRAYAAPAAQRLARIVGEADAAAFAVPIYNFDINAAAKNAIELVGRHLTGKMAGFLCAAGGQRSYMSLMATANSLMLDFRTLILPRFVYATGDDFDEAGNPSGTISERVGLFGDEFLNLATALGGIQRPQGETGT